MEGTGTEGTVSGEDFDKLISDELHYGQHGSFVENLFRAWEKADPENRELLRPAMAAVVAKYKMPTRTMILGKLRERIALSSMYLIIATRNYAADLGDGEDFVLAQYMFMCEYTDRPVIIVWHDITDEDKKFIRSKFRVFRTIVEIDAKDIENGEAVEKLKALGILPDDTIRTIDALVKMKSDGEIEKTKQR